jgi:hypothetical protein
VSDQLKAHTRIRSISGLLPLVLVIVELGLVRHSPGLAELGSGILIVIMVLSWGPSWPTLELERFRRHHHERTACT